MTALIIRGDARQLSLPDASVDLIVTSPPYWALRSYTDGGQHYDGQIGAEPTPWGYLGALWECTAEWVRVLKPTGSLFVVLGDKYANRTRGAWRGSSDGYTWRAGTPRYVRPKDLPEKSLIGLPWRYAIGCIDQLGLILRSEIVWSKPSPMPESVTDRVRRSHEQVFHFTTQPRYFSNTDAVREPHKAPNRAAGMTAFGARDANLTRTGTGRYTGPNPAGAIPASVWEVATQPLHVPDELAVDHDAAYPPALVRRIVSGWSPDGGTVLDPFGGTGTTALVASVLGRRGVTVDRSADYCRIAAWRTTDRGERARALGLPKPEPVLEGQEALFASVTS
ncbi:DNA-methyltransferase [Streptosporangium jomthongense]|uniref:Methyltransferase n=1 Tax=Streptosporangium jomthongense TaxID=1193683 RepID=A0ABV8FF55_9ACTN